MEKETLEEAADKYGFRVPYDGSNDFYDKEVIKHFIAGAKWMQEQMEKLKDFDTWKEWKNETFKSE
jgi:hypothetical protein